MKERPILFTGEMVRAILDGRKTQTRRIVKLPKVGAVVARLATKNFLHLGLTKGGDPLHPLMLAYDRHPLVPFDVASFATLSTRKVAQLSTTPH